MWAAGLTPERLRCEYKDAPLAIESPHPRLFWNVASPERGQKQTAYEILAADSAEALAQNQGDLWDSGKTASSETIQIPYDGKPLASGQQVFWKVRVWDRDGKPSAWSKPTSWTMGLLRPEDWKARWIGYPVDTAARSMVDLTGAKWIWDDTGGEHSPAGMRWFRHTLDLPAGAAITSAKLAISADDRYILTVNGARHAGPRATDSWRSYQTYDVTKELRAGSNALVVQGENAEQGWAGVIAKLVVQTTAGTITLVTDGTWETATRADGAFAPAHVMGDYGTAPWNTLSSANQNEMAPPPYFRKTFSLAKPVKRALLYATALGAYEVAFNGRRASDDILSPGWTDFRKRVHYLAYDVTNQLHPGTNAIGAILGDGWYASYLAFTGKRHFYGGDTRLRLQLDVEYVDGTKETIGTDDSWKTAYGPIAMADMLMGCAIDTRKETSGWDTATFNDAAWKPAAVSPDLGLILQAQPSEPIRTTQLLTAHKRTEPTKGVFIYDLGQNMVGWARLKVTGQPGETITVRHGERLNPDGTLYTTNLRAAKATDTYVLKGGTQILEPKFVFHGFQYVEISGASAPPAPKDVTGVVFSSDLTPALAFDSDNPLLNKLVQNIDWGYRGNSLDVPTDCPQRNERAGWTGDAQVFAKTAMFHRDAAPFYTKWLDDMEDGQSDNGSYPDVAPTLHIGNGNAAWEDAGVICTYRMYEMYGDRQIISRHWDSLTRFMEHLAKQAPDGIRPPGSFGDWLLLDGVQRSDIHGTAYYYFSAKLMAEMADALGKIDEANAYRALTTKIRDAFNARFVTPDGKVQDGGKESQTFYALALDWNLIDPARRPAAAQRLTEMIAQRGGHLATGFIGTPVLLPALAGSGHADTANALLLQDTYPSWLYQVKLGATTLWERWDGWTPEKGFEDPGMNSFNHYWLGCVGEWMYTGVAGIDTDGPGWQKIVIRPNTESALKHVHVAYDSIRGRVESGWTKNADGSLTLSVTVPANVTARVYVPAKSADSVTESGKSAASAPGITAQPREGDTEVFAVGSGKYTFQVKP